MRRQEIGDFVHSWGVSIGAATLKYNLAILQKVKYIIAMLPSDSIPRPIPTRDKYRLIHNIYRLITIVFKKQEQHVSLAD